MVQMVLSPTSSPSTGAFPMALLASPKLRLMSENSCFEFTLVSSCFLRLAMPNMECQLRMSMWYSWMQGSLQRRPPRKVVICLWNSSTLSCMMYSLGYFTSFLLINSSDSSIFYTIQLCSLLAFSSQPYLPFFMGQLGFRCFLSIFQMKNSKASFSLSPTQGSICDLRLLAFQAPPLELSKALMRAQLLRVSLRKLQASFSFIYQEEISSLNFLNFKLSNMLSWKPRKILASQTQLGQPFSNSQSETWTLISSQVISPPTSSITLKSSTKSSMRHFLRLLVCIQRVRSFLLWTTVLTAWQMRWMDPSFMSNPLKMILRVFSSEHYLRASLRYSMKFLSMRSLYCGKYPQPQHLKESSTKGGLRMRGSSVDIQCLKSRKFLDAKKSLFFSWLLLNSAIIRQTQYKLYQSHSNQMANRKKEREGAMQNTDIIWEWFISFGEGS